LETGLLWFDDDPRRSLEDKIRRAAAHYQHKHGHTPNVCFVHPSVFNDDGKQRIERVGGLEVRVSRSVLLHHFWLGVAEDGKEWTKAKRSLIARVEAEHRPMTPERALQLVRAAQEE
jgi:hypothetical protein